MDSTGPRLAPRFAPHLAPGLRVVARGRHHLQVGLYAGRRVVLPRTEQVEQVLDRLLAHEPQPEDTGTALVLDRLARAGCLGDAPHDRRPHGAVAVLGRLGSLDPAAVDRAVTGAGLTRARSPEEADVVVVLSDGELPRDRLDPLVRRQVDHVVVRLVDGGAVLGPFVVPGLTACLRCVDAHERLHDPDHAAVTARYAQATARVRPDGVPDVVDPTLASLALAWTVRDVAAHLTGRRPSTWSRTLAWDLEPSRREEHAWSRHPECGCSWSPGAHLSCTIGA